MSTSPSSTTHNYSIQAIPAAFLFAIIPHGYGMARLMYETKNQNSTAMYANQSRQTSIYFSIQSPNLLTHNTRPRTNLETWKSKLPTATWNHLARARGAHLNSLEVFPLFAAAMVRLQTPPQHKPPTSLLHTNLPAMHRSPATSPKSQPKT